MEALLLSSYSRGIRKSTYWVTKGGPLSFSSDVLSSAFKYGYRCFTEYHADIPDFSIKHFLLEFDMKGTIIFEDGGLATASGHIRYKSDV